MKIRWEPRLMEEVVRIEARHNKAFAEICQQRLEKVYGLPEEQREEAFSLTYSTLFEEYQLDTLLKTVLAEFPPLQGLAELLVFRTVSPREEGTELSRDQTKMGLRLRAERLRQSEKLTPYLRHELRHTTDMLDTAFGYRDEPLDPVREHLVPRRYQVLWDCYIDGRLERLGQKGIANKEERQQEFERLFPFLPRRQRAGAFQKLWQAQNMTHQQLLEWAKEPTKLSLLSGSGEEISSTPISGTFCPICQFPTFAWADPESKIVPYIQKDYPTWTREEGICERCYEYYLMHSEREGVTP